MAAKARGEQEKLEKRVGRLEAKLGVKSTAKRRPRAKPSKPKTAKNS